MKFYYECPNCKKDALVYNRPVMRPAHYYCECCEKSFKSDVIINIKL